MSCYGILLEHERDRVARITPNPYRLTKREMEVAGWLGRGLDCSAIACKLSIGKRAVSRYISSVTAKVGARNALHLCLIINTLPGLPVEQPTFVVIEDFREAFGMRWRSPTPVGTAVLVD